MSILCMLACMALPLHAQSKTDSKNGDITRVQNVMAKLRRGETVNIAVLGGSITTGYSANPINTNSWAAKVQGWWIQKAKECGGLVNFYNQGVSGTDSAFAVARIDTHIKAKNIDLVILEFAMNDQWLDKAIKDRTYESIIRQMMMDSDRAIVALFVNEKGEPCRSAQDVQQPIVEHYGLPFISWRDEVRPLVEQGKADWNNFFTGAEGVHPNNEGHASIGGFINARFDSIWDSLPSDKDIKSVNQELPKPITRADYVNARFYGSDNLQPEENNGWAKGSDVHPDWLSHGDTKQGWTAKDSEVEMSFKLYGETIGIMFAESSEYRNAEAWVTKPDGTESRKVALNCANNTRVGYLGWVYKEIVTGTEAKEYILHVKVRKSRKTDDGKYCNITGILVTGDSK